MPAATTIADCLLCNLWGSPQTSTKADAEISCPPSEGSLLSFRKRLCRVSFNPHKDRLVVPSCLICKMKLGQINYRWLCLAPCALCAKKIINMQILLLKKNSLCLLTIEWKYNSLTVIFFYTILHSIEDSDVNTAPICVYTYIHICSHLCTHTHFIFIVLDLMLSGRGELEQDKAFMAEDATSERQHI